MSLGSSFFARAAWVCTAQGTAWQSNPRRAGWFNGIRRRYRVRLCLGKPFTVHPRPLWGHFCPSSHRCLRPVPSTKQCIASLATLWLHGPQELSLFSAKRKPRNSRRGYWL